MKRRAFFFIFAVLALATAPQSVSACAACTGDPNSGTVPVGNVIGKARFIVWPPSRWGGVGSVNPQQGQ